MIENPQVTPINPLLAKVQLPGKIFQLPSRGVLYNSGELRSDCKDGEIHVHPMSALAEINMKNPDMLFSGKAINEVFRECIPDILQPEELFGKDIDAIMIFLRMVTYGSQYEVSSVHNCKDGKLHTYVINIESMIQGMTFLDPTELEKLYKVELDNGQVVTIQPVRYKHLLTVLKLNENKKEFTADDLKQNLIVNLLSLIKDVDGISDPKMIEEWLRVAKSPYVNRIADSIDKTNNWGPKLTTMIKCKDCGTEYEAEIPINPINFFIE